MSKLKELFPSIQTKEEVLKEINSNVSLKNTYSSWTDERQREFLDVCTGVRGHRIMYDMYFKYVFDIEANPENLKAFLGDLLGIKIDSLEVLSNSSALVDETHSLMVMDILVRLSDGTIVNVEVQKIGYLFPGQRAACYSADLLLRQYAKQRKDNRNFSYKAMKDVITIVLIEESQKEFSAYREYIHKFRQQSDTGLELPLLQEYYFLPLDIFRKSVQDKPIKERTALETWLTFLTAEDPEEIYNLILTHPEFEPIYQRLYRLCRNIEGAMQMFSEQLRIMDQNTIKLMIDELRDEVQEQKHQLQEKEHQLQEKERTLMIKEEEAEAERQRANRAEAELLRLRKQLDDKNGNS